jgi:hypothetical protein
MTGKTLRVSMVMETYPQEINGVAMTVSQLVGQLSIKGHHVELIRPNSLWNRPWHTMRRVLC